MKAVSLTFYDQNKGQFGESFANGLSDKYISQMKFRPGGLAEEVFTSCEPVLCRDRPAAAQRAPKRGRSPTRLPACTTAAGSTAACRKRCSVASVLASRCRC